MAMRNACCYYACYSCAALWLMHELVWNRKHLECLWVARLKRMVEPKWNQERGWPVLLSLIAELTREEGHLETTRSRRNDNDSRKQQCPIYFRKNQMLPLAYTDVVRQSAVGTFCSVSAHVTGRKFQSFEVLRGEAAAEFQFLLMFSNLSYCTTCEEA